MTDKEMMKISVEEFERLRSYMLVCEKDLEVYKILKSSITIRYNIIIIIKKCKVY